jgi:hypothetical protein
MTDHHNDDTDFNDADAIIARSIDGLRQAGIGASVIAGVLQARAVFLWRQDGLTDDQIVCEFGTCIQVPLGRNPPMRRRR